MRKPTQVRRRTCIGQSGGGAQLDNLGSRPGFASTSVGFVRQLLTPRRRRAWHTRRTASRRLKPTQGAPLIHCFCRLGPYRAFAQLTLHCWPCKMAPEAVSVSGRAWPRRRRRPGVTCARRRAVRARLPRPVRARKTPRRELSASFDQPPGAYNRFVNQFPVAGERISHLGALKTIR